MTNLHAQCLTQSVKEHIMGMTVVSAKEMTNEIASNRIKLNNTFNQIKEKGGHPFILIRGEIKDLSELWDLFKTQDGHLLYSGLLC